MRKISPKEILTFFLLMATAGCGAYLPTAWLWRRAGWSSEFAALAVGLLLFYVLIIAAQRALLAFRPLPVGSIDIGSPAQFTYHVYLLINLLCIYPLTRSAFLPVPLLRMLYIALGASLGENTFTSGIIFDPQFVTAGSNTLIGQGTLLIPHVIENERLAHFPIAIGDNVTIGAHAIVLADVRIGNGAIVAAGAVVPKGTRIGDREVWGGVPARKLKSLEPQG